MTKTGPSCYCVVLLLFVCGHSALFRLQGLQGYQHAMHSEVLSSNPFNKEGTLKKEICKRTVNLFSGENEIRSALKVADKFHDGGGNLKTIQEFLDNQIQGTLEKFGLNFTDTNGLTVQENVTIPDFVYNLLKENDIHHRGGYDQRILPGRFEPYHPALIEKRIINVMESVSLKKWKAAIGPIGPLCKSIDRIQTRKQKHYEDKFMCSFLDLNASSDCNIMSIGSNDQWGFENEIVSTTGCHTHTFDCTMTKPLKKPNLDSVSYYSACISHKDRMVNGRKYSTYQSLWKLTGMHAPPKMLKIDVSHLNSVSALFHSCFNFFLSFKTQFEIIVGGGF
mmetsp:Transcript_10849/g.18060  ORF Transcript_10849/g.18060 Transcript_10849/m.18060 type:complete len:336 (-) Transcript_10849:835-1842(-)